MGFLKNLPKRGKPHGKVPLSVVRFLSTRPGQYTQATATHPGGGKRSAFDEAWPTGAAEKAPVRSHRHPAQGPPPKPSKTASGAKEIQVAAHVRVKKGKFQMVDAHTRVIKSSGQCVPGTQPGQGCKAPRKGTGSSNFVAAASWGYD